MCQSYEKQSQELCFREKLVGENKVICSFLWSKNRQYAPKKAE